MANLFRSPPKMGIFSHMILLWLVAFADPVDQGGLSQTCTGIELFGRYSLDATCYGSPTSQFRNQLDLNLCIGISHTTNVLEWGVYGKLSVYCSACTLEAARSGSSLTCTCKSTGSVVPAAVSSLRLDDGIRNVNGTLNCIGGMANVEAVNSREETHRILERVRDRREFPAGPEARHR